MSESIKTVETAKQMLIELLGAEFTPLEMIESLSQLNGMVACGLHFSVLGEKNARRKAFQVQTDIAKATRKSIEKQKDENLKELSFESMFGKSH